MYRKKTGVRLLVSGFGFVQKRCTSIGQKLRDLIDEKLIRRTFFFFIKRASMQTKVLLKSDKIRKEIILKNRFIKTSILRKLGFQPSAPLMQSGKAARSPSSHFCFRKRHFTAITPQHRPETKAPHFLFGRALVSEGEMQFEK